MSEKSVYKVLFAGAGKLYEVYAKSVSQSNILGFVELEELLFNEHTSMVVDPAEERLKSEFAGVKCTLIPIQSVLRIDMVDKQGAGKIKEVGDKSDNVAQFPGTNSSQFFNTSKKEDA